MNQNFKDKLNEMRSENPTKGGSDDTAHYKTFDSAGHVRNVDFVQPNGEREFFNYAYLVRCKYSPDESTVTIRFTNGIVILKGIRLTMLHIDLQSNLPKEIIAIDPRYNSTVPDTEFIVNSIEIVD